ncbi:phage tail assembly protein [Thalassospira xiamenensis]|uniref:phage tail assembly protein n=1 Tax=Thalassospira xiamenensis TaxID=220697 RepID=UPI000DEE19DC|nr:phage tail assembly protein [Thalassospira xiamenensis]
MTKKTDDVAAVTEASKKDSFDRVLTKPLPYGADGKLDKLTFRRPMSGDLRGVKLIQLSEMDTNSLFILLPRITSPAITEAHVQQLDPIDALMIMQDISINFFSA